MSDSSVFPYIPLAHNLNGDHNEAARHLIIRCAFLNCLIGDDRVQSLFWEWARRNTLVNKAERVHSLHADLAARAGVEPKDLMTVYLSDNESDLSEILKPANITPEGEKGSGLELNNLICRGTKDRCRDR